MKKIFWTSVVWIAIVVLFWTYIKLFNSELGQKMSDRIYQEHIVIQTGTIDQSEDMIIINDQLTKINNKLADILNTLSGQQETPVSTTPYSEIPQLPR